MKQKYKQFTLEEANHKISALQLLVSQYRVRYNSFLAIKKEIESTENSHEVLLGLPKLFIQNTDETSFKKALLGIAQAQLKRIISEIEKHHVILQDPYQGLIDFLAQKDGIEVFLCWQYNENVIRYWHTIEGGFAGRKEILPGEFSE